MGVTAHRSDQESCKEGWAVKAFQMVMKLQLQPLPEWNVPQMKKQVCR